MNSIDTYSIHGINELFEKGEITSEEITSLVLQRIDQMSSIRAFLNIDATGALETAQKMDRLRQSGDVGKLAGIPIVIKDNLCTVDFPTTCGSKILEHFIPPYDATVVDRLRKAGAVLVGKTSMDEFAMGSTNEHCAFGTPVNPWKAGYVTGGSSGGSAAAVATGQCFAALGSDTGGSIRQPASLCGIVGIKPTYGRVSRYGLVAFASSLDQVGPMTRDVRDAALMLEVISGHDPRDSTSINTPVPNFTKALNKGLAGLRIGIPAEYFSEGLDPEVERTIRQGIRMLVDAGAEPVDVSLPHTEYCVAVYYLIASAEASSNLARFDGVRYGLRDSSDKTLIDMYRKTRSTGFGEEVKRRILIGTYALSAGYYDAYYKKASQVRTLIREDFDRALMQCDVLVSPVCPTPAWKIGEKKDDPLALYLADILTSSANLAGIPGMSVPCGFSAEGLPIGMQLQAAHFNEEALFRVGYNLELQAGIKDQRPAPEAS